MTGMQLQQQLDYPGQGLGALGGAGLQRRQQARVLGIAQAAVLQGDRQGAGAVVDQAAGEAEEQGSERGLWHATRFPKRSGQANERV